MGGLDTLMRKIDETGDIEGKIGSGRPKSARGGGDSYIRGDRGVVSEGLLMDQLIRENISKVCRKTDQSLRVNVINITNKTG